MLYRLLANRAKNYPNRVALVIDRRSVTFGQLLAETTDVANFFLKTLDLSAEDSVIIGLPACPEFYALLYGAAAIGAAAIPILPTAKIPAQIKGLGRIVAAGEPEFLKAIEGDGIILRKAIDWDRKTGIRLPHASGTLRRRRLVRKQRVFGASSSGTTGNPTLNFRTAELLVRRAELYAKVHEITSEDTLFCSRPFSSSIALMPLIKGAKLVVQERLERFKVAKLISAEKVTVIHATPFFFDVLASVPTRFRMDFSSLRLCISGGAPLPRSVFDAFYRRFGIRLHQAYTGSQIAPAFSYNYSAEIPEAVGEVSRPFPMAVVDERARVVEPGEIGEIVVDVARVKDRFFRDCLEKNPRCRGRYLYTGDLGKTDPEGNLYVVGRKSPLIKVGGNRVSPAEVEGVLRSHPHVREAVVYPMKPGQIDEAVGAIVVASREVTTRELAAHCARYLYSYKCPRKIELREKLPRNARGKIIRDFSSS